MVQFPDRFFKPLCFYVTLPDILLLMLIYFGTVGIWIHDKQNPDLAENFLVWFLKGLDHFKMEHSCPVSELLAHFCSGFGIIRSIFPIQKGPKCQEFRCYFKIRLFSNWAGFHCLNIWFLVRYCKVYTLNNLSGIVLHYNVFLMNVLNLE